MKPLTLYLLRHERVCGPSTIYYSQMDIPLSPEGRRRSVEIARRITALARSTRSEIKAVFSSDLSRALTLGETLASMSQAPLHATAALREVDFGRWSGLSWKEIERGWPEAMQQRMKNLGGYHPPGGESLEEVRGRLVKVLDGIIRDYMGSSVALVAHGGVNRVMIAHLIGLDLQHIFCLAQDFGCLNIIDVYPDGNAVIRLLNGLIP